MIIHLFKQQLIGTLNLSLPTLIAIYFYPLFIFTWYGPLMCAFCAALHIGYLNKNSTDASAQTLIYVPTGIYKQKLEDMITECGIDKQKILLRYAYSGESIALNINNVVVIDPTLFSFYNQDSSALSVINIFNTHIEPTLNDTVKTRLSLIKQYMANESVGRFIFKHELGHFCYNYAWKKIINNMIVIFCAAYTGITSGVILYCTYGQPLLAIICALFVSFIVDSLLSHFSNATFKLRQEKNADLFAIQHSSAEDIQAAADFFEKNQEIKNMHKDNTFLSSIPSFILTGHPNGYSRAQYIRKNGHIII